MNGAEQVPGGHRVQIEQTASHLRELGVQADVAFIEETASKDLDLAPYDLVHGFDMSPQTMRHCRKHGTPVVLSTIYWSREYTTGQHRTGRILETYQSRFRRGLVLLRASLQGQASEKCDSVYENLLKQRTIFEMADALLPNSQAEAEAITRELQVTTPCYVVPNSVDHKHFT
jgi:hypothetical protein